MSMYPWDWVAPLVPEPENPMGPMPQPPVPVQPQLVPGPRGFQRALEYGMAPLADMPWVPMRGRGENFLQGFIGGVAAKQRAKGMGRAQENEARARAADEANKEAKGEYRSKLAEWHRYQRDASRAYQQARQAALKAMLEGNASPKDAIAWADLPAPMRLRLKDYKGQTKSRSEWSFLDSGSKVPDGDKPEQAPTLAQRAAVAAAPMESREALWNARSRETVENPQGAVFPRVPAYPAAADSAFAYRQQADLNRAAVMGLAPGGERVKASYDDDITGAQNKAMLASVVERIKADASLSDAERKRLRAKVDKRAESLR